MGAILNSAQVLLQDENLSSTNVRAGTDVQRSAMRVKRMIDDLFIFTRTRLGDALPIDPTQQDMGRICEGAADEVRASCPAAQTEVELSGELAGVWDGSRISQLLVNLLTNAVQHASGPVSVNAAGDGRQIAPAVSNAGRQYRRMRCQRFSIH